MIFCYVHISSVVRQLKLNSIKTYKNYPIKDFGRFPMEIDAFLDKDKHLNCIWLKRPSAKNGICEVNNILMIL